MSSSFIFLHYGELWLKAGNKNMFIRQLKNNIERILDCKIELLYDLAKIPYSEENMTKLGYVFGTEGFGKGKMVDRDITNIVDCSTEIVKDIDNISIQVTRRDKSFEHKSPDVTQMIIKKLKDKNLDKKGENKLMVKIDKNYAYIYIIKTHKWMGTTFMNGLGGMPIGTSGKVGVLLSGGIDSPVATWYVMKRGCTPIFIHYHSLKEFNIEKGPAKKIGDIINELKKYSNTKMKLYAINFEPITKQIVQNVPAKDRLIVYRRYMLRLAETILENENAKAFVTGDSLAQVASQTLDNMTVISSATQYPILRPLIGMDKKEITAIANFINTFNMSILSYDDTCSKFLPKHPTLKGDLKTIENYEDKIGDIKVEWEIFNL